MIPGTHIILCVVGSISRFFGLFSPPSLLSFFPHFPLLLRPLLSSSFHLHSPFRSSFSFAPIFSFLLFSLSPSSFLLRFISFPLFSFPSFLPPLPFPPSPSLFSPSSLFLSLPLLPPFLPPLSPLLPSFLPSSSPPPLPLPTPLSSKNGKINERGERINKARENVSDYGNDIRVWAGWLGNVRWEGVLPALSAGFPCAVLRPRLVSGSFPSRLCAMFTRSWPCFRPFPLQRHDVRKAPRPHSRETFVTYSLLDVVYCHVCTRKNGKFLSGSVRQRAALRFVLFLFPILMVCLFHSKVLRRRVCSIESFDMMSLSVSLIQYSVFYGAASAGANSSTPMGSLSVQRYPEVRSLRVVSRSARYLLRTPSIIDGSPCCGAGVSPPGGCRFLTLTSVLSPVFIHGYPLGLRRVIVESSRYVSSLPLSHDSGLLCAFHRFTPSTYSPLRLPFQTSYPSPLLHSHLPAPSLKHPSPPLPLPPLFHFFSPSQTLPPSLHSLPNLSSKHPSPLPNLSLPSSLLN
ncbi:hypothetical protein C7M84_018702 [Penaeus vannamei]|uniref:Uncharacterized protein n=1 Tax=Penaeus vannamei TaxID=6689 RepID=A0A3R7MJM8_PENVA|nr:hypothetical protein C7M84_018702 [Penaeus vannamei]